MSPEEIETRAAPFRRLGAGVHIRTSQDGSQCVWGIQAGRIPDVRYEHAALLTRFDDLRALGLQETSITDAALQSLSAMQHLESLDLEGTAITDAGLALLVNLRSLEYLALKKTRVTQPGVAELARKLPNCEISSDFDG